MWKLEVLRVSGISVLCALGGKPLLPAGYCKHYKTLQSTH